MNRSALLARNTRSPESSLADVEVIPDTAFLFPFHTALSN
jgi:hypothetical protein